MTKLPSRALELRASDTTPTSSVDTSELTPRKTGTLMRKYDIKALMPNMSITEKNVIAPATPLFEETAGAFARGTLITTTMGPIAVEDLLPGDQVDTRHGPQAVTWIGSTTFVPKMEETSSCLTTLYRITAEAFGFGIPLSDLLVGPAARMIIRREKLKMLIGDSTVLAPVSDFCDGDRVFEVTPPGSVQLYHIALRRHGTIKAGGFELESYHPGRNIGAELGPNMRALFMSMFPNLEMLTDFGELTFTRSTRDVIDNLLSS